MRAPTTWIRIIATPPGEAPESVRQAWVGLVLPTVGPLRTYITAGVLSGPRTALGTLIGVFTGRCKFVPGYLVEAPAAVAILAKADLEAAEWWRVSTPHLLVKGHPFVFPAPVCQEELLDGSQSSEA